MNTRTRFALGLIKFDPSQDDATYDALPGRCVFGFVDYEQPSVLLARREMPTAKPRFNALLHCPIAPGVEQPTLVQRRFISVSFGTLIDFPGELVHFWTFVNPQGGAVRAIYEVLSFDEEEAKRRVATMAEAGAL
jgi:hypothetical protein